MTLNNRREMWIARTCTAVTLIALTGLIHALFTHGRVAYITDDLRALTETAVFAVIMFFMAYGNLLYQICLAGYYKREDKHRPPSRIELEQLYDGKAPSLSVLVPSYKEEHTVIWQTLVSAALAEYPQKDVVLLIDDPHRPRSGEDMRALEKTRKIPATLQTLFDKPLMHYRAELGSFMRRMEEGRANACVECNRLSMLYDEAADWLDALTADFLKDKPDASLSHIDRFFVERVMGAQGNAHRQRAKELRAQVGAKALTLDDALRQYRRLIGLFSVNFSSFERKKYANLSHESNKAMNLNSYISLMGKSWREVQRRAGLELQECEPAQADFTIAAPDFVNTIDADSQMLPGYALNLVHTMLQTGHERIAVIQSPCSAYPECPSGLERAAGACIDLQFKTHQGYTHWNATFWVGANAMLRYAALNDIREVRQENGHEVSIYIQDRTVIEDTESSMDLVHKGWRLYNYPERMTFSSMPSDFGSLLIQRRRWANGGLLILPKLISYAMRAPKRLGLLKEVFMRFHYLASTATGCLVALLFLLYPFSDGIGTIWIPLSALPAMILYMRDLRNTGYKIPDFLRICILNLLLLPIIIGGVLKSLEQMVTGKKIPFGRTPKVPGRTSAPALYSFIEASLPFFCAVAAITEATQHHVMQALVTLVNATCYFYALVFFMGIRETVEDIEVGIRETWAFLANAAEEWLEPVRRIPLLAARLQRG